MCWEYGGNLDNEVFAERMELLSRLMDHATAINKGSDGETSEFSNDFVKSVCSQVVKE